MLRQVVFQTVKDTSVLATKNAIWSRSSAWRNSRTQDLENETIVGRGFCFRRRWLARNSSLFSKGIITNYKIGYS